MKKNSKKTNEINVQVEEVSEKVLQIKKMRQEYNLAHVEEYSLRNEKIWVEELKLNNLEDMVKITTHNESE